MSGNRNEIGAETKSDIEVSQELSDYMHNFINKVIDEAGCRIPCSENERKGAEIVAEELKKISDEVSIEKFKLAPRAFLGWIKLDVISVFISILLFFLAERIDSYLTKLFLYIISLSIVVFALIAMWYEFFNYSEFLDRWYKKKESQNVVGKIHSKGEMKRIIIFSGHIDSALQFNLLAYLHYLYPIITFWGLICFFLWAALSVVNLVLFLFGFIGVLHKLALWLVIFALPAMVILYFFVFSDKRANKVPGAVDNLSAVSIVLALGHYLKDHPEIIPENTEVRLVAFGCEEAGLRGAFRYVQAHYDELKKYHAIDVNMDTIESPDDIKVVEFEPTTRTKHSKMVVDKLLKAAENAGVKASLLGNSLFDKILGITTGGTDAAAFSKAKIDAANIVAIRLLDAAYFYHQPNDTPDKIKPGALENTLKILIQFLINEKGKN
ncbi:MAG: M28 family metallopeptidase [Promethearchaeota archaeon]